MTLLNKKSIKPVLLVITVFIISLSSEFGCTKKNNERGGASLKEIDSVAGAVNVAYTFDKSAAVDTAAVDVADILLKDKEGGKVSFRKFKLAISDSVNNIEEIRVSFSYPTAIPNPAAAVKLQKNFIEQAFGEKYVGLEPLDVVKRAGKDLVKGVDRECQYAFLYSDTVSFPISGFLQYETSNYEYTCGAHGAGYDAYCLYNIEDGNKVEPKDIFVAGWEQSVTKLIIEKHLKNKGLESLGDDDYAEEEKFIPAGNMLSFYDPKGITFFYNSYVIAPYAEGPQYILVSWDELKPYLNKNSAIYPKLKF